MNNFQNATLNSYKLIVTESKNNPTSMSLIPTYGKVITRLDEITTEIDNVSIQQAKNTKGITTNKNELLEEVADYVIDVAGAAHSYAIGTGNTILQSKVDYKTNKVHTMKQAKLIDAADIVLEEAGKIPAGLLAEEGISTEELTEFGNVYNQFKDTTNSKREAEIDQSNYTDQLAGLFAEAASLKKNTLDRLATQFQRKAPEFYYKYKAAANVIYKRATKSSTKAEAKA